MSELISQIVREHIQKLYAAIDKACYASLYTESGVKVTYHEDGSFTVELSPDVPRLHVYEFRNTGLIGYSFDPHKLPWVENLLSFDDTPGNGQPD